jgi:L-glyceraldehyde 3-phosphate reductase
MFNRWIEDELLDTLDAAGAGCIAFSPLAQGMLTSKYLDGIPEGSRAAEGRFLTADMITPERIAHVRRLNEIAGERGQTLAQMAVAWTVRDERVTSALIGASSVAQLEQNVAALERLGFDDGELAEIDRHAVDSGINLWAESSEA